MAGLCEGGNEPPGSLKVTNSLSIEMWTVQQLKADDCCKRANFCDEMIRRIDENPNKKVRNLIDLIQRIIQAVGLITPDMMVNTWQEVEYRFGTC
ncbi:hypothetical protein ANN_13867 [Periplaneta americana]|uniref:Uncharacterized protein n=1 Tax=Periplaneta americana TaxID=6978 RepID=A0ABQ8SVR0_PERAM|nr:hypothetical protein ANN_13867 [Periplaneta americana]